MGEEFLSEQILSDFHGIYIGVGVGVCVGGWVGGCVRVYVHVCALHDFVCQLSHSN